MQFRYQAKTITGETKVGVINTANETDVVNFIRENGWIPVDISSESSVVILARNFYNIFTQKISLSHKTIFYRQFSIMLTAGIPIEKTLLILADEETNKKFKQIIYNLLSSVRSGAALFSALETERNCFGSLEIAITKAGEEAGLLDSVLLRISELLKRQDALRKKLLTASIYPLLVLFVAVSVLLLVTVFVLPQFESTFSQMNIEMPTFSKAVFAVGNWLRNFGYIIPLFILLLVVLFAFLKHTNSMFARKIDGIKLKLPLFGGILLKATLSRCFRTLGLMLKSGVSMLSALRMSGEVAGNIIIKDSFDKMFCEAEDGNAMYNILSENRMYPVLVAQLIKIGEETGHVDDKFIELAALLEEDLDDTIRQLTTLLEPILIIVVGFLVAIMLFAVYLPILSAVRNLI